MTFNLKNIIIFPAHRHFITLKKAVLYLSHATVLSYHTLREYYTIISKSQISTACSIYINKNIVRAHLKKALFCYVSAKATDFILQAENNYGLIVLILMANWSCMKSIFDSAGEMISRERRALPLTVQQQQSRLRFCQNHQTEHCIFFLALCSAKCMRMSA
jgi:hypothetical protein